MKRGGPNHPKLLELCDLLKCRRPTAIGYLELLWAFTANYAPQGDIGRYSDRWIEAGCDWRGGLGKLVAALVAARYLDAFPDPAKGGDRAVAGQAQGSDGWVTGQAQGRYRGVTPQDLGRYRLLVHDWADHADDSVRKKLLRQNQWFIAKVSGHVSGQTADEVLTNVPTKSSTPTPTSTSTSTSKPPPLDAADTVRTSSTGNRTNGRLRRQDEMPLPNTAEFIRGHFPDVDDSFMTRLHRECTEAAAMTGNDPALVTDEILLQAVIQCTRKNQNGAGLYLKTVPPCIKTWSQQLKRHSELSQVESERRNLQQVEFDKQQRDVLNDPNSSEEDQRFARSYFDLPEKGAST